jgi:hypothetical protein
MCIYIITYHYITIFPLQSGNFSLGPLEVAEVWRVAFRQVVRIGESAKVGKCHGKCHGSTIFWRFSGDFLRFLERLILYRQGNPL